ncbi:hypothetical protein [Gilvimarinus sp. DA14]|uniref:hypothetical protein n=1 Tax=Gilvimarinus sp. DA14 TaxID=2956798 RepID=UPI0020B6FD28|nr:hypothetical protein [Gilvimarinus sp. DA14]UTF61305.1 hypothetical protein NHM04_05755 [Gilvimarinus sp. DA14]
MIAYLTLLIGLFTAFDAHPQPSSATPTIVFTCSVAKEIPSLKILESYYREAFAALGYGFEMQHRPSKRSLAEARSGMSDGECARVTEHFTQGSSQDDHLIPIPVVVASSTINIWSRKPGQISIGQLMRPENNICYVSGSNAGPDWLRQHVSAAADTAPTTFAVTNYETGLRMLSFGRITHCIGPQISLLAAAQKTSLSGQVFNNGELFSIDAGPLLNVKHKDMAADFTRELQKVVDKHGILTQ